jgi:hypothetical protein
MWRLNLLALSLGTACVLSACSDVETSTNLNPEGPPMVAQVFLQEKVRVGASTRIRQGLGFGDHPQIEADPEETLFDDRTVTAAVARPGSQNIRVVLDELIVGNAIEELACADGSFSPIPVGTNPDDIAKCAGPDLTKCAGPNTVCVGANGPIGILDEDEDGAADDFRMIDYGGGTLAVEVVCDDVSIPLDQTLSFYNPSGNQQIPAAAGANGLGPALILVPSEGLRTSAECTLRFNDAVVDKDNTPVCAPPGGQFLTANCSPGDTSEVSWNVEPLEISGNDPTEGQTGVALTSGGQTFANILLQFNAAVDEDAAIAGISLSCGGVAVGVSPDVSADDQTIVTVQVPGGYPAASSCTLTVATAVADIFGGAMPADFVVNFTTAEP